MVLFTQIASTRRFVVFFGTKHSICNIQVEPVLDKPTKASAFCEIAAGKKIMWSLFIATKMLSLKTVV